MDSKELEERLAVSNRAIRIAAKIMQAAGLCRYEKVESCRHLYVDESVCDRCIESWLRSRARKELRNEHL